MVQSTSRSKRLIFSKVLDRKAGVISCRVSNEVAEYRLFVVPYYKDFLDLRNFGDGIEAVFNDRVSSDVEQRLEENSVFRLQKPRQSVDLPLEHQERVV